MANTLTIFTLRKVFSSTVTVLKNYKQFYKSLTYLNKYGLKCFTVNNDIGHIITMGKENQIDFGELGYILTNKEISIKDSRIRTKRTIDW